VTPLGSNTAYSVNFALICATHQDLAAQVAAGAFREDLLYRIQEFHLRIPPLREWPDTRQFIQKLWQELGAGSRDITLSEEALHAGRSPLAGQCASIVKPVAGIAGAGG
jgi:transcriptional regulator of acetoin/glycerol metabolism